MKKHFWLAAGGLTIMILGVIYFWQLGCTSLAPYDEAWYAAIARDMVANRNPFLMTYNGHEFSDHPPLAIALIALSGLLLGGFNSFSVRLVAACLGVGCLILIYFLADKFLRSNKAGLLTVMMLGSSLWFILRVRSGNLDITWLFFFLLTLVTAFAATRQPKRWVWVGAVTGCLLLSKTLIGLAVVPLIVYIAWWQKIDWRGCRRYLLQALLAVIVIVGPWYIYHAATDPDFLRFHFVEIGLKIDTERHSAATLDLKRNFLYLHSGIGVWYKVAFLGLLVAALATAYCWRRRKTELKTLLFLWSWLAVLALPLMLSPGVQVWHLLPIYTPLFLIANYSFCFAVKQMKTTRWRQVGIGVLLSGVTVLASKQIKDILPVIYPATCSASAERQISERIKNYPEKTVNLNSWFLPTAVFYSEREIVPFMYEENAIQKMAAHLQSSDDQLFIVEKSHLDELDQQQINYSILENVEQYYLIGNYVH